MGTHRGVLRLNRDIDRAPVHHQHLLLLQQVARYAAAGGNLEPLDREAVRIADLGRVVAVLRHPQANHGCDLRAASG